MILPLAIEPVSKHFTMLSMDKCKYCDKALAIIKEKGWTAEVHYIEDNMWVLGLMKRAGLVSFPQIWNEDTFIGGCSALEEWVSK